MISRLFLWETTADKVKSLAAWVLLSFVMPGMYTVYRWWSWLFNDYPTHYYLDRGWLYAVTTLNVGMLLWLMVLVAITWMVRNYYTNRTEVIREVSQVIQDEPLGKFPVKFLQERPPDADEDYHAQIQETEMTDEQMVGYIQRNRPTSLQDVDMLLSQCGDHFKKAKLLLLNIRKKWQGDPKKIPVGKVVDFTDA